ncbi:MAG: diaminopimelate decarboxylase [Planctomycetota bacterium]|jgi:diaminopimelate decarboxylase|nr:diaminopimelate decarboxylase [Planctomycetota bacterium]
MEHFKYTSGRLFCEDVDADALAAKYGTPLYVYSKAAIAARFAAVEKAFAGAETTICFSVKSCSNIAVLGVLRSLGSGFDIVSGGELTRALRAGADTRKIVFAGVGKTDDEIRLALDNDILMLNVESEAELDAIQNIAAAMGMVAPVALRVNPDVDARTHAKTTTGKKDNKFGIDFATASRIVRNIAVQPNVRLIGLDMHLGSPVPDAAPYAEALEKAVDFIREHRSPRAQFEYLNAGGGFGLLYRDETVPSFQEYADAIVPRAKRAGCRLIVEPGRSIAGNAAVLLSRVLYVKDNGHKVFTIVDAGMNDLMRPALYDAYHFCWPSRSADAPPSHLFRSPGARAYCNGEAVDAANGRTRETRPDDGLILTDVVGPICESSDWFAKGRRLPPMERGQVLAVFSAGAYGFSMACNYNSRPRAAEVMVEGAEARVIRERETADSLLAGESLWE